jgi:hypothetical protein
MSFLISEDAALKTKLQGFRVADEKNANRLVEVWYANPDVETRNQSYPYMTIELLDASWASYRQMSGIMVDPDKQGTVAPVAGTLYSYEIPVPYDLIYQITTYARHPRHDRAIIAHLLNTIFPAKRGWLAVRNDLGTETGYRHMFLEEFTKRDTIEDNRRLYRNVLTVTVTSEGAAQGTVAGTVPTAVNINTTTTHIPSDKQPI